MGTYPWGPHGPQSGPNEVTPNPTPAYVPPPAPSQDWSTPNYGTPSYGGGTYTGPAARTAGPYVAPAPRKKSYIFALILTFLLGPLGLFYATKKGAVVMLLLLFAVPVSMSAFGLLPGSRLGHPFAILENYAVMEQMWSRIAFLSIISSVIAVWSYNSSLKART